ncbi:MAG: hypothetical protein ACYC67_11460 [Prosthecobacter sp.]
MKTLLAFLAMLCAPVVLADGPAKITNLKTAMKTAKSEGKLLFVQMGRETCGNCQALKGMIENNEVRLSSSQYVYADVDCDDASTDELFEKCFQVEGSTLPFVVVASPDGTQLAARTGGGSVKDYTNLLRDAQKAAKKLMDTKSGKK